MLWLFTSKPIYTSVGTGHSYLYTYLKSLSLEIAMSFIDPLEITGPICIITHRDLLAAISHLYKAMELLAHVNNEIVDQPINALELTQELSDGWLEVNKCRLYTEDILYFEELLIPAMGLINDAKMMLESIVYWKLGMTLQAKYNILRCLREAAQVGINPSLAELELCLQFVSSNGDGD